MEEIEFNISQNHFKKFEGGFTCPKCEKLVLKDPTVGHNRLRCLSCIKMFGSKPDFCAICLKDWKNSSNAECGNEECDLKQLN